MSLVADPHCSCESLSSFWKISLPLKELWHAGPHPPDVYLCANRRASVEMKALSIAAAKPSHRRRPAIRRARLAAVIEAVEQLPAARPHLASRAMRKESPCENSAGFCLRQH